jgi:hypothetical protein
MNVTSKLCLQCSEPIGPERRKFCSQKCALKWHNAQIPWSEKPGRNAANLRAKERYWQDPEVARAKARKWRELNPDGHKLHIHRAKQKNAVAIKEQSAGWRERNRENLRDRAQIFYYQTRDKTPWKHILRSRFRDALKRGIPFELTPEWAAARWTGCCEMSGIPFDLTRTVVGFYSPSIDKIDASKGYLPDNCRFVLFSVNGFKSVGTDSDVLLVAQAIVSAGLKSTPEQIVAMKPTD